MERCEQLHAQAEKRRSSEDIEGMEQHRSVALSDAVLAHRAWANTEVHERLQNYERERAGGEHTKLIQFPHEVTRLKHFDPDFRSIAFTELAPHGDCQGAAPAFEPNHGVAEICEHAHESCGL